MSQFVLSDLQIPPRHSLAPSLSNDVDFQIQSPLFTAIPAEIRNRIFSIALTAYDDRSKPYRPQNWFYRPDWHFHPKISTTLLRTCKRIYLECHLLPLALNSHTFWAGAGRGPPADYFPSAYKRPLRSGLGRMLGNWNACEDFRGLFNKLTAEQRGAVGELHFFFQQCDLEAVSFSPPLDPDSSRPITARKLKITMRHQDWHWWECDQKLALCPWNRGHTTWDRMDAPMPRTRMEWLSSQGWGAQLQYIQGLKEFELELETLVAKKGQMDEIVERAKRWVFPLKDGDNRFLRWDCGTHHRVKESRWEEDDLPPTSDVLDPREPDRLRLDDFLLSDGDGAAFLDAAQPAQRIASGHTLSTPPSVPESPPLAKRQYYVVSLTWKVRATDDEDKCQTGAEAVTEWRPMSR